jgi:hypothetical protein
MSDDAAPPPPIPEDERPGRSYAFTCLEVACLLAAGLFYWISLSAISNVGSHVGGDGHPDNGLDEAFAGFFVFLLWVALTAFAFLAWAAERPRGLVALIVTVCGLGLVGSSWAIGLMDPPTPALWTAALLPWTAALLGAWAHAAARVPAPWQKAARFGFILLALAAFAPLIVAQQRWPALQAQRQAAQQRQEANARRAEQARTAAYERRFAALNAGSRLDAFLEFFGAGTPKGERALARARTATSRQSDAVRLLRGDRLMMLAHLSELDLAASDELCTAYREALERQSGYYTPTEPGRFAFETYGHERNIAWLTSENCDLRAPVSRIVADGRAAPANSAEHAYADRLAAILQRGPGQPLPAAPSD